MKKLSTDELLKILSGEKDIEAFAKTYSDSLKPQELSEFFDALLNEKDMSKADVVKKSGLDRTYAYQILGGQKSPSRDKVLALAFGFELNSDECDRMLMLAGFSKLYVKSRRDSCIIFALNNNNNIMSVNELLHSLGEEILR